MMEFAVRLAENVRQVRERMGEAARRSGRSADKVTLVAVTKYVDHRLAGLLPAAGCEDLGESRPQELWAKAAQLPGSVRWHLIGHLQTNKANRTLHDVDCIHSVDSLRILRAIEQASLRLGKRPRLLLEVHISQEASKSGFEPDALPRLLEQLGDFRQAAIVGLMAMASHAEDPQQARREFAALRHLRDQLVGHCPDHVSLNELSMGMSGDFEQAIEEGSTMVRIGSALWAGIDPI